MCLGSETGVDRGGEGKERGGRIGRREEGEGSGLTVWACLARLEQ